MGDRELANRLARGGYSVLSLTSLLVEVHELASEDLHQLEIYTKAPDAWLAFLSPTAVCVFEEISQKHGIDIVASRVRIAAQGPGTSEVARRLFQREVDLESTVSTAEVFAEQLSLRLGGHGKVLVPQSAEGRDVLGPLVRAQGNEVETLSTYELKRVVPLQSEVDAVMTCEPSTTCILFMSPSAVRATVDVFPNVEHLRSLRAISIGPSTSKALRESGLTVSMEAVEHTEEGVIRCVREIFQANKKQ